MIKIPHKTKQISVLIIKLLIVTFAFYFIYNQLAHNDKLDWLKFQTLVYEKQSIGGIIFIISLSIANRYIEILKWKNLVSTIRKISLIESTAQVLGSLTAGIFTPNGIGEYAGKALFYEKSKTKKIIFLNLICNGIQMAIAIIFGFLGLIYFNNKTNVISTTSLLGIVTILVLIIILLTLLKKLSVRGYSIELIINKINEIPKNIHQKNILLGLFRYLVLMHQYYFLFLAFDVELPYLMLISTITAVYLLASSLPSFQFLDFAVKGSVAIFFFGMLGINDWVVVFISTLMWFLNIVLPVIIGSYFVINFKLKWK